jgi:hypothetical protein
MPIIPATPEVETGRMEIQGELGKKVSKTPFSINKLSTVARLSSQLHREGRQKDYGPPV